MGSFFNILAWLTGNHPLESRGKHFKNIFREGYKLFNERISDKETGGTICEKAHRGQETIGLGRCVGR